MVFSSMKVNRTVKCRSALNIFLQLTNLTKDNDDCDNDVFISKIKA